jgi:hypothetical protein
MSYAALTAGGWCAAAQRSEDLLASQRVVLLRAFVRFTGAERADDGRDKTGL